MSIEPVKRIWFLLESGELDGFVRRLARWKVAHIVDLPGQAGATIAEGDGPAPRRPSADLALVEDRIQKLSRMLDVLQEFAPPKRPFVENFVDLPVEIPRAEFERAVSEIEVDGLYHRLMGLSQDCAAATREYERLWEWVEELAPWGEVAVPPETTRAATELGTVPLHLFEDFIRATAALDLVAVEKRMEHGGLALVAVAWHPEAAADAGRVLGEHNFQSLKLGRNEGKIAEIVERMRREMSAHEAEGARRRAEIEAMAPQRRGVQAVLAHWGAELERCQVERKTVGSRRIVTLASYVRVRDLPRLEERLAAEFPAVSMIGADPTPDEAVPVDLRPSRVFGPAQFLTRLFGLPDYFSFDPSPYLFFSVMLFFGLCLGDVVYGAALLAAGWWLGRKAGDNVGLRRLMNLLAIGGGVSIAVGVVTGSWAGDLFGEYIGKGNFIGEGIKRLTLLDSIQEPMMGLGIVLGIGVLNQFYGIFLHGYREWRRGNWQGVVFDSGLWALYLPGLLLLFASMMMELPGAVRTVALALAGVGAAGLVLTQGRHEKTWIGKAVTGMVSLYGIVGSYGTTAFIGDTLSYSRLLALGLTTSIVAQSWNAILSPVIQGIAGLPYVGLIGAILLILTLGVVGHVFNLLISTLGAFVHSARLIFLEFFSRFYEGGAVPFVALGTPRSIRVVDQA